MLAIGIPGHIAPYLEWTVSIILLTLYVFTIVRIVRSNIQIAEKFIWILVVFLFPILGMVIFWIFGPRSKGKIVQSEA
ncbi:MAG: PLDc N-terminal domain-containing protein [Bacteroidota bacterium]